MRLSDIFTARSIATYFGTAEERLNNTYLSDMFFPAEKKLGLDLKWIKGRSGLPVTLAPCTFDAERNVRDRIGITAIQTEMPFFSEVMLITESDRQEINRARDSADPYVATVISRIYNDTRELVRGAKVVPERMVNQLLSPADGSPKISIVSGDTAYNYNYDVDGTFATTNFMAKSGTAAWTDYTNSDPLADIEAGMDAVKTATGEVPEVLILSTKTLNDLKSNVNVQSYIVSKAAATGGTVRITKKLVKDYLFDEFGLTVLEKSDKFINDNGVAQAFFPDDIATLVPATFLGNTWYGTTPEESDLMANSEADVAIVDTGVAITVITPAKVPVKTETIASEIVLPSFEGMDKVFIINTNAE